MFSVAFCRCETFRVFVKHLLFLRFLCSIILPKSLFYYIIYENIKIGVFCRRQRGCDSYCRAVRKMDTESQIEQKIGYVFKNKELLRQAFVHSSYANEESIPDNERMEFFGDAVLEYISTEYLFSRYPRCDAGELSKLRSRVVSADGLRPIVDAMGIMDDLLVSDGAGKIKSLSKKIEANLYEAVLCAIYLDGGMDAAKKFVLKTLKKSMDNATLALKKDCKTVLQEYCQNNKWTIEYRCESKSGPDNKPKFVYSLWINGKKESDGYGASIKRAEQDAAAKVVNKWGI